MALVQAFMAMPAKTGGAAVEAWYSEVKDYDFSSGRGRGTGHFTQVESYPSHTPVTPSHTSPAEQLKSALFTTDGSILLNSACVELPISILLNLCTNW